MAEQRLQKLLAERGLASRRAAEEMIAAGRVAVNGTSVREMGTKVDAAKDSVTIDGKELPAQPRLRYILLNKPAGYLCSTRDERDKKSVLTLLPELPERLYPVGRLDYDTCGLLLLTNDGALTQALLHPSRQVEKTYLAELAGPVSVTDLDKLRQGLLLPDGPTAPAKVNLKRRGQSVSVVEITIHEGRKRQIRRMCENIGHPVRRLTRIRMGPLSLGGLKPGQWRELSPREVQELKAPTNHKTTGEQFRSKGKGSQYRNATARPRREKSKDGR